MIEKVTNLPWKFVRFLVQHSQRAVYFFVPCFYIWNFRLVYWVPCCASGSKVVRSTVANILYHVYRNMDSEVDQNQYTTMESGKGGTFTYRAGRVNKGTLLETNKSSIQETLNLSACEDSSSDTKNIREKSHLSIVTYHMSPVTCHMSPLTYHMSPDHHSIELQLLRKSQEARWCECGRFGDW